MKRRGYRPSKKKRPMRGKRYGRKSSMPPKKRLAKRRNRLVGDRL